MKFGSGQSVRRTEDIRFVTGHGQYTDDLHFDRETFVAFVRSPQAHAKILSVDTAAAKAAPGVVAVLTQADLEAAGAQNMPAMTPMQSRDGSMPKGVEKPLLAKDHTTFSGEAIAMVIAETYAQARDAAEMVAVDYEQLPAAGTLESAPNTGRDLGFHPEQRKLRLGQRQGSRNQRSVCEGRAHRRDRRGAEPHHRELDGNPQRHRHL